MIYWQLLLLFHFVCYCSRWCHCYNAFRSLFCWHFACVWALPLFWLCDLNHHFRLSEQFIVASQHLYFTYILSFEHFHIWSILLNSFPLLCKYKTNSIIIFFYLSHASFCFRAIALFVSRIMWHRTNLSFILYSVFYFFFHLFYLLFSVLQLYLQWDYYLQPGEVIRPICCYQSVTLIINIRNEQMRVDHDKVMLVQSKTCAAYEKFLSFLIAYETKLVGKMLDFCCGVISKDGNLLVRVCSRLVYVFSD